MNIFQLLLWTPINCWRMDWLYITIMAHPFEFSRHFGSWFSPAFNGVTVASVGKMDFDLSFDNFSPEKRKFPTDTFSPVSKRRKFSTKDCPECGICSDDVFEVVNIIHLKMVHKIHTSFRFAIPILAPKKCWLKKVQPIAKLYTVKFVRIDILWMKTEKGWS